MADEDEDAPKLRVLENEEDDEGTEDVFDFRKMPNFQYVYSLKFCLKSHS